jgi:hypothetical protein
MERPVRETRYRGSATGLFIVFCRPQMVSIMA